MADLRSAAWALALRTLALQRYRCVCKLAELSIIMIWQFPICVNEQLLMNDRPSQGYGVQFWPWPQPWLLSSRWVLDVAMAMSARSLRAATPFRELLSNPALVGPIFLF